MPRPISPRPVGEHVETLTRIARQLEVDRDLSPKTRARLRRSLMACLKEFQAVFSSGT